MSDRTPAKRNGTRPARGYSWPAFERGNTAAMTHGARSRNLEAFERRASELMPAVFEANGHLDELRDGAAVVRYAMALARVERVYAWLSQRDDPAFADVEAGKVHAVYERLERWERQADAAEERLCIAPLTRAKLGLDRMRAKAIADEALESYLSEQEAAGDA
jgi:hypothetical protein